MASRAGEPGTVFQPQVLFDKDGDCLEFLISNESFYAQRLDGLVTVYYGEGSGRLVGSVIKGISKFLRSALERAPGFKIEIRDGRVRLGHLFTATLWLSDNPPAGTELVVYERLREEAEKVRATFDASEMALT